MAGRPGGRGARHAQPRAGQRDSPAPGPGRRNHQRRRRATVNKAQQAEQLRNIEEAAQALVDAASEAADAYEDEDGDYDKSDRDDLLESAQAMAGDLLAVLPPSWKRGPVMIDVPVQGRPDYAPGADSLVGVEANAFFILGHTRKVLQRAGASPEFLAAYQAEATSGDYDHLLQASMAYLDAGEPRPD